MTYTKEYAKLQVKIAIKYLEDSLSILYSLEDQTDYKIKEVSECIDKLQKINIDNWELAKEI